MQAILPWGWPMHNVSMAGIPFNPQTPDLEAVRQIIFERLRREPGWKQVDVSGDGYAPYVEYKGSSHDARNVLIFSAQEVFWRLIVEGILSPGINSMSLDLPWFHVTTYGKQVLLSGPANPHDPSGYLRRLHEKVSKSDSTVIAYLTE